MQLQKRVKIELWLQIAAGAEGCERNTKYMHYRDQGLSRYIQAPSGNESFILYPDYRMTNPDPTSCTIWIIVSFVSYLNNGLSAWRAHIHQALCPSIIVNIRSILMCTVGCCSRRLALIDIVKPYLRAKSLLLFTPALVATVSSCTRGINASH